MLLEVIELHAGHGEARALHGVSLQLAQGQGLAVLGRNGAGKTTLLETLMGLTRHHGGEIVFDGRAMRGLSPVRRARAGIGWVPQEREVFGSLTVEENLTVAARPGEWTLAKVYALFPRLQERRRNLGSQLSGGEQQMLAIGRALTTNPRLLLLDEPMEGLAPIIVQELSASVQQMVRATALTVIVVEQHPVVALSMSHRALILEQGLVVHEAASDALREDPAVLDRCLGIGSEDITTRVPQPA